MRVFPGGDTPMAHKTSLAVESLEGRALLSGLSNMAAASTIGWGPPQLTTNPDPLPAPLNPAATSDAPSNSGWSPPQLITNPDPIPLPVNPGASSGGVSSGDWSPPQ